MWPLQGQWDRGWMATVALVRWVPQNGCWGPCFIGSWRRWWGRNQGSVSDLAEGMDLSMFSKLWLWFQWFGLSVRHNKQADGTPNVMRDSSMILLTTQLWEDPRQQLRVGRDWGRSEAKRVGVHTGMAKGNKISILIFRAMVAWSGKSMALGWPGYPRLTFGSGLWQHN